MKAFISYSHKDEGALDRLHTHLAVLRREHHITEWYDRDILAGNVIDQEISEQLETCELFLALVSSDYLASGYCYDREMTRALDRHHAGEVRVAPIIIRPCDWKETPLGRLKALPRDGKPVSTWVNEDEAYLDVVTELRRILTQDIEAAYKHTSEQKSAPSQAAPSYRVKREFDEIDRSLFRDQAFSKIRTFFESEMANIDGHQGLRGLFVDAGEQSFSCTLVNKNRSHSTAKITVTKGGGISSMGDISYTFSEYSPLNSANGILTIEADEYELYLTSLMTAQVDERHRRLTPEDAGKIIWRDFIEQAGVSVTITNELTASGSNKIRDLTTLVESKMKTPGDFSHASMTTGKEKDLPSHNRNSQKETSRYEVALSFAGEQRNYVEDVARVLQSRGVAVFYDEFESIRLWGKHLVEELHDVYENRATYAVMFISREYVDKVWPNHERQSILSRAVREKNEYILQVRFDDTPVPGIPTAIRYVSAREHTPAVLAAMIAEKIGIQPYAGKASDVPPPRSTSLSGMAVFDYSNHNGRYVIGRNPYEFETKWSKASNRSIRVYNDPHSINGVALAKGYKSIEHISNAASLDYTSRARKPQRGEIVVLRNVKGFYAAVQVNDIKDDTRGDEKDELRFQYAILANGSDDFTTINS